MTIAIKAAKKIFSGRNIKSVEPAGAAYSKKYKIAVFVPLKNVDELTFKMAAAGAGVIGKYTVCSFRTKGVGTFLGGEGSSPKAGKKGKFEMVDEVRLEMICDKKNLDAVIDKIYSSHPYEEPACEIYEVMVRSSQPSGDIAVVKLKKKTAFKSVFKKINSSVDLSALPGKIKNKKFKEAVIDYSPGETPLAKRFKNKTLYIKKYKNIINVEII